MQEPLLDKQTHTIYMIVNTVDSKAYIGQTNNYHKRRKEHVSSLRRGVHYNKHLQRAFTRYGELSFEFRILETVSPAIADDSERSWIRRYNSCNDQFGYNNQTGGVKNKRVSAETIAKISASQRKRLADPIVREKLSESRRGKPAVGNSIKGLRMGWKLLARRSRTEVLETARRGQIASANLRRGVPLSAEHKQKVSAGLVGKKHSAEHSKKVGDAQRGKKLSAHQIQLLRTINTGSKHTAEHRQRISDGLKRAYSENRRTPRGKSSNQK